MPFADAVYVQDLNPLGNRVLSTLVAGLPVLVLFYLLVVRRWLASLAAACGAAAAVLVAGAVYGMPWAMAGWSFAHGVAFGLLPIGWIVFSAMLLYNVSVHSGQFKVMRRSIAGVSGDARIQAILIGFAFGAFMEGAAGGGTPVAVCGAILVGLGFHPFTAAVICLIANTSPVAFGGMGTPILTLAGVTGLPAETLSVMAGHQLPIFSCLIPLYMVKIMCTWGQTLEVWPALAVGGGSFALFQYFFATMHVHVPGLVLFPMTDVGGGVFSLVVTAAFLKLWRPRREFHYEDGSGRLRVRDVPPPPESLAPGLAEAVERVRVEQEAEREGERQAPPDEVPLSAWAVAKAWAPWALMSVLLGLSGYVRQLENREGPLPVAGPVRSMYAFEVPTLHHRVERAERLLRRDDAGNPIHETERAVFELPWLTTPGTPVFLSAVLSMLALRMGRRQVWQVFRRTAMMMRLPIPTIACMLGLSYVTRYSGMDATLGVAFAETGLLYPFFAALLGWLGVFLTGTDAGSNALF
ncbi:MAG TPA: L-lactate permease, partial [Gemmataceae bacterium]